jgi:hypothetical protein
MPPVSREARKISELTHFRSSKAIRTVAVALGGLFGIALGRFLFDLAIPIRMTVAWWSTLNRVDPPKSESASP